MNRPAVDMSPEGVARRLEELGQLYRLARSLGAARRLGPAVPARSAPGERHAERTAPAAPMDSPSE